MLIYLCAQKKDVTINNTFYEYKRQYNYTFGIEKYIPFKFYMSEHLRQQI